MLPYLVLGGAQLAVGAAALFGRYALTGAGALAVAASRLTIAALLLGAYALVRPNPGALRPTAAQRRILAAAGVALAAHFATWIASLELTPVALSTLLVSTTPLWTALYDGMTSRKRMGIATAAGLAVGGMGIALVVGFDRTPPPHPGHPLLGALLAVAGAVAFAAYLILVRSVREALDTRTIVTGTYGTAAAALVAAAALAHQPPPPLENSTAWAGILAMALVSQMLGHTAINASLRWFSASAVSFTTLLEPVVATALAALLLSEPLSPGALAGGLLVLAAIAIVLRQERTEAPL